MALETAPASANNAFTRNHTQNATIASSETTSDEVILGGRGVVNVHLPAMNACYISYLVKINPGDTAAVLVDDSNSTLTFPRGSSATITTARVYQEPRLSGIYSVQFVASAAQSGGARTIGISARGQNPIPTVTDIEATIVSGATVTANQGTPNAGAALAWPVSVDGYDGTSNIPVRVANSSDAVNNTYANTGIQKSFLVLQDPSTGSVTNPSNMRLGDGATGHGIQASGGYWENAAGTFDRLRTNLISTIAASSARTSTLTVADQTNFNGAMLHAVIVVTVMASGGLTPVINGKGNLGTYYALLTGAKITGTGTTVLRIGPGFATAVNAAAADMLPRTWNMVVTPDDATSITYSIEGNVNE